MDEVKAIILRLSKFDVGIEHVRVNLTLLSDGKVIRFSNVHNRFHQSWQASNFLKGLLFFLHSFPNVYISILFGVDLLLLLSKLCKLP